MAGKIKLCPCSLVGLVAVAGKIRLCPDPCRMVGPVVRCPAPQRQARGSVPALPSGDIPATCTSGLGLVSPVTVYCDWVETNSDVHLRARTG